MSLDSLMIRSANLLGAPLKDASGKKLGTIREIFFERDTGQARFVALEFSGLFGTSGKYHPIPWRALRYDQPSDSYRTDLTKDFLKTSPAYDREQFGDTAYAWTEQAERYFRTEPI
jgi:hypothetical protein